MQIQATGPTGVNSELSERESASPKARVYVSVCVCAPPVCVCGCLHGEMGGGCVCVWGGEGLKSYLLHSLAPPRFLRHMTGTTMTSGPEGPTGPCYT